MTQDSWTALKKMLVYYLKNLLLLDQLSIHGWLNDSVTVGNFVLFWPVISVFIKGLHSASKCACCLF